MYGSAATEGRHGVAEKVADSERLGWFVDTGGLDGGHTNSQTGQTAEFGWRCSPQLDWYGHLSGLPLLPSMPPIIGIGPPCLAHWLKSKPFIPLQW